MNVNSSRFHLLLGSADWGRCRVQHGDSQRPLSEWWADVSNVAASYITEPATLEPAPLVWDGLRNELRLQRNPIALPPTPGEIPFTLAARRAAAADRHGNIYWIDADRRRLRVRSVGSGRESAFWPAGPLGCAEHGRDFAPLTPFAEPRQSYQALAVTADHYLVVAYTEPTASGLLVFDLVAGGPPHSMHWPRDLDIEPFVLAPRPGGGVWVLDRAAARLWELDRTLALAQRPAPAAAGAPAEPALFQPLSGPPRLVASPPPPFGIDLCDPDLPASAPESASPIGSPVASPYDPIRDPIAVVAVSQTALLVLDRNGPAGPSRVYRLRLSDGIWRADPPVRLGELAHDFVLARPTAWDTRSSTPLLLVTTASGNQALAFAVDPDDEPVRLRGAVELFPLRRYGGRALVEVQGKAWYDSGDSAVRWVPVVEQPRLSYREEAEMITPVLDGREPQCVWDRLLLDGCIGADTRVEVWCRAADECLSPGTEAAEPIAPWSPQPRLRLRGDGAELAWLRAAARQTTRRAAGSGTWELLLQGQRGRWLQLRLRLSGNGTTSPRLRALRIWYPRFSYPRRFLPAVYREEQVHGDFLERFLANMEQVNTQIEDRIARVQALLDPRSAPAEALDWLASWFDLALDPAWEERRRRLFIAHALDFFRWRGTPHGLRIALALAFEPCIDEGLFKDPDAAGACPYNTGIRIVEAYQTRLIGALAAGDPDRPDADTGGPLQPIASARRWSPDEGNAGLARRYAQQVRGNDATTVEQLRPFPLFPPAEAVAFDADVSQREAIWNDFCRQHLGFVPAAGADERRRWQCFLKSRYPDAAELAQSHGWDAEQTAAGFDNIDLPADWPQQTALAADWREYCALPEATRLRWRDFLARRWRRIGRLNDAYQSGWQGFGLIPLPDHLPATAAAQADWLQFEGQLLRMLATAHRFSVLLPVATVNEDAAQMQYRLGLAKRITELEKPAHTVFDVRFYWSLNRVGAARLGLDTLLDAGSRAKALIPDTVLGRAYLGAGFVASFVSVPALAAEPARRPIPC